MTAVPFPILRLPANALQMSLKQMSPVEHLTLSFVSIRTKNLIPVLDDNYSIAFISMSPPMSFSFVPTTRTFTPFNLYFKPDQSIFEIRSVTRRISLEFSLAGFTVKQWIEHLSSVFIQNKDVILEFPNLLERNIEDFYDSFKHLHIIRFYIKSSYIQEYSLVKLFPRLDQLAISEVPTRISILVQNYSSFKAIQVTLDSILVSNCRNFRTHDHSLSNKNLNLFVRHWIKGSNPRLRYLYISFDRGNGDLLETILFRGIDYIETMGMRDKNWLNKKFEIWSYDGANAEITIRRNTFLFTVK